MDTGFSSSRDDTVCIRFDTKNITYVILLSHEISHEKRRIAPPLSLLNHPCLDLPSRSAPANPICSPAALCALLPILPWCVLASHTFCKMPHGSIRIYALSPAVYSASRLSFLSFRISTMITISNTIMTISLIIFIVFIRIPPFT